MEERVRHLGSTDSLAPPKASLLEVNFLKNNFTAALANFVQPVFTTFLSLLATEMHANIFEIGLIGGGASVVYAFMPFVMGRFSDRGQARRFLIILSLALLASVAILYSLSANPVDLIVLRLVEGLGWAAFWPSMDSAITHDTQVDPKRALAVFNLSWSSAAAMGPIVASFVVVIFSIRQVFVFTAVFLVVALLISLLPSSQIAPLKMRSSAEPAHNPENEPVITVDRLPGLRASFYVLSLVLCTITSNTILSFSPPYLNSQGLSFFIIGVVSGAFSAARFLGYLLTSIRRINNFLLDPTIRSRNILVFIVVEVLSSLLMTLRSSSGGIYLLSIGLMGLGYSFVYYVAMVGLLAETRKEKMGAGAGIFENSIGVGSFAGPVIAGSVAGNSFSIPFIVPSLCAIPMLGLLLIQRRSGNKPHQKIRR